MAPLPPNNTGVVFFHYTTGITKHVTQLRYSVEAGAEGVVAVMEEFITPLQPLLSDEFRFLRAEHRAQGTNFTLPIPLGTLAAFAGSDSDAPEQVDTPKEFVWVGKSITGGRAWELSLYGLQLGFPPDYRFEGPGVPPSMAASILALQDAFGEFVAIDGGAVVVYDYVNVNNNSHWETEARKSG